jgi:ATP phosphoribosyltransferase
MTMLRVAVPNKGTLSEPASEILAEAGYRRRTDSKDLTVIDPANQVEFFFLRPKDIAIYVGSGELDFGITGRDLVGDSDAPVRERLALGFGSSSFATPDRRGAAGISPTWPADGSPPPIPILSEKTWQGVVSKQRSSGSTARSRSRSNSALLTQSPTS